MPRPPVQENSLVMTDQQALIATHSQQQSMTRLQQIKEEEEMQQLQMQQQLQQQHQYQLQQQAQMQQLQHHQVQLQQQQQSLQYSQDMGTSSNVVDQNVTANNLVAVAVQATTNAANAAATAGGATAGGGYAFPRNSPEFACENVGERIKGKRRKYCPHEVTALVLGVQRYADDSCPWSSILRDPHLGHLFHGRSGVDLKDKWRTLIKTRPELAAYTENRKNHRKYRPFSATEERALLEGVKKYNGQRNVWSLILIDKELGSQFNDRSNVQLKDKFRTMRRAGTTSSLLITGSATSRRTAAAPSSTLDSGASTTATEATSGPLASNLTTGLTVAGSPAVNGTSRVGATVTSASQQAATLLVQNSNAASAMFGDPNLYLAGSFSIPPHLSPGMNMQQMTTTQSRQQTVQAQTQAHAQAHAQAQAIANAQARAAQVQLEAQMRQLRAHGGQQQVNIKQQYQALSAQNNAFNAGIHGYHLVGNQIVPQQAIYYQNAQSQQQAHLQQQQLQQQLQQRQLQQQQQQQHQQQLAAAIAAVSNQQQQQQQKSQSASAGQPSGTSRGASVSRDHANAHFDKHNDINSIKAGRLASSLADDLVMEGAAINLAAQSASTGSLTGAEYNTRTI